VTATSGRDSYLWQGQQPLAGTATSGRGTQDSYLWQGQQDWHRVKVTISKELTRLLRHDGLKEGLRFRPDGFTRLTDVLNRRLLREMGATEDTVRQVVKESDKQRFSIADESGMEKYPK